MKEALTAEIRIHMRIKPSQHARWHAAAEKAGNGWSDFVRWALDAAAEKIEKEATWKA